MAHTWRAARHRYRESGVTDQNFERIFSFAQPFSRTDHDMLSKQPDKWICCAFTVDCQNVERKIMFWCKRILIVLSDWSWKVTRLSEFSRNKGKSLKIHTIWLSVLWEQQSSWGTCVWVGNLVWKPKALRKGILYWVKSACFYSETTAVNANELILLHPLG